MGDRHTGRAFIHAHALRVRLRQPNPLTDCVNFHFFLSAFNCFAEIRADGLETSLTYNPLGQDHALVMGDSCIYIIQSKMIACGYFQRHRKQLNSLTSQRRHGDASVPMNVSQHLELHRMTLLP
jgi:hypothetical protein